MASFRLCYCRPWPSTLPQRQVSSESRFQPSTMAMHSTLQVTRPPVSTPLSASKLHDPDHGCGCAGLLPVVSPAFCLAQRQKSSGWVDISLAHYHAVSDFPQLLSNSQFHKRSYLYVSNLTNAPPTLEGTRNAVWKTSQDRHPTAQPPRHQKVPLSWA